MAISMLLIGLGSIACTYGIKLSKDAAESNTPNLLIGLGIILIIVAIFINVRGMMGK